MIAAALQLATYGLALAGCAALAVRQLGHRDAQDADEQHACTHDWPATPSPGLGAVRRVLTQFDRWHPVAVRQLALRDTQEDA